LNREEKQQAVTQLSDKLKDVSLVVATDYRGLTVEEITQLRNELRSVSSEYKVVKNTLLKRATEGTPIEPLHEHLTGPTAILVSPEDPVGPLKVLVKHLKNYSALSIKGGVLEGKALSADETKELSTLPGRQELLSKVLSLCVSPHVGLLNTLNGIAQKFVRVLHAIEQKKAE
jgi:large subunit ribosomal protein L10